MIDDIIYFRYRRRSLFYLVQGPWHKYLDYAENMWLVSQWAMDYDQIEGTKQDQAKDKYPQIKILSLSA